MRPSGASEVSRAQAAADAANGLATLPAFETWGGVAAEAAREAIGKTRRDLDAHGREAQAVANAARNAADEIEHIKSELASVKADAESLGMEIDPMTGEVLPGRTIRDPMEALLKEEQLQPRVNKIIAEANMVDIALANAVLKALIARRAVDHSFIDHHTNGWAETVAAMAWRSEAPRAK